MRKDGRRGSQPIVKTRQAGGALSRVPHPVPRTRPGILQSLTLDNPVATERLRRQCTGGTVPVSVFIELLNLGYPPDKKDPGTRGGGINWIWRDGHPVRRPVHPNTPKAPRTRQAIARTLTLENPVVMARLRRQWENGSMPPALLRWFVRNGRCLDPKPTKPRLNFIGVPWLGKDPMAEQEAAAIAKQKTRQRREAEERQAREQAQSGRTVGPSEAEEGEELEELEVYRPKEEE